MGGRGKAGKIKMASHSAQGRSVAEEIMATPMPPNRQNPNGEPIKSLLVEERLEIAKEAYCAITIDRAARKPGLHREPLRRHGHRRGCRSIIPSRSQSSTSTRPSDTRRSSVASSLSARSSIPAIASSFPRSPARFTTCSFAYGAKLVEINPLALTADGRVIASDAKVELDDDALFRNPRVRRSGESALPLDEDELLAAQRRRRHSQLPPLSRRRRHDGQRRRTWRWRRWTP